MNQIVRGSSGRLFASKMHSLEGIESCGYICEGALEGEWVVARMKSRRRKGELGELTEVAAGHIPDPNNDVSPLPDPPRISLIARKLHVASDPLSRYSRCDPARCVYADCQWIFPAERTQKSVDMWITPIKPIIFSPGDRVFKRRSGSSRFRGFEIL